MPDVRNCRRCGKIFNYIGGQPLCPACRQLDEEDFKRVKEYLYHNPGAVLSEVSTKLEIQCGEDKEVSQGRTSGNCRR
jgi:phage FluMu protein Com